MGIWHEFGDISGFLLNFEEIRKITVIECLQKTYNLSNAKRKSRLFYSKIIPIADLRPAILSRSIPLNPYPNIYKKNCIANRAELQDLYQTETIIRLVRRVKLFDLRYQ
jgi:hypothetical protein